MKITRNALGWLAIAVSPIAASLPANGQAPAGYHEAMIKGGGQIDALGVVCGKVTIAQAKAHKAKLKQMFAAKGVAPATFETVYEGGYGNVIAGAKANPVAVKARCAQIARGQLAG